MHNDAPSTAQRSLSQSPALRYGLSLLLLVAVVGGIAWLAQNQRRGKTTQDKSNSLQKPPLEFARNIAYWGAPRGEPGKEAGKQPAYKEIEVGGTGQYDFLFKNVYGEDVEITHIVSACDCTNVQACTLSKEEYDRLSKHHADKPAEPLVYAGKPEWQGLHAADRTADVNNPERRSLRIAADQGGIIRVGFIGKKSPGQELRVTPTIWFRLAADPNRTGGQTLIVPVRVQAPIQFFPMRFSDVALIPGGTGEAKFTAWSTTRDDVDFNLEAVPADKLFTVSIVKGKNEKIPAFEDSLEKHKQLNGASVRCFYSVTVTVHETKDGMQMEQGAFYRKLYVFLDGRRSETDISGLEVIGRMFGDVDVGVPEDRGRIRFKPFDAKVGATRTIQLLTDGKVELKTHQVTPPWVNITLEPAGELPGGRRQWSLTAEVPADTKDARPFNEYDGVVLRIAGKTERFIRIPLEGTISGGR